MQLASVTESNNGRVRGVAIGYRDGTSSTTQTVLAVVEGEGVFRYHNGAWFKSTGVSFGATRRSKLAWPDNANSGVVYLLDLSRGLYRSSDGGQSWENIWPSMSFRNSDFYNTGYIALDDKEPDTLFLSIQGDNGSPIGANFRVYRMLGASTGVFSEPDTSADIIDITNHSDGTRLRRPGPLVFAPDGRLWLSEQQDARNSVDAGLYFMNASATDSRQR